MKQDEISKVLIRIEDKTNYTAEALNQTNKHLATINGTLQKHQDNLVSLNTTIYGKNGDKGLCEEVRSNTKNIFKLVATVSAISATIGGGVGAVCSIFAG